MLQLLQTTVVLQLVQLIYFVVFLLVAQEVLQMQPERRVSQVWTRPGVCNARSHPKPGTKVLFLH